MPLETRTRIVYNPDACTPEVFPPVPGCMASDAINYEPLATVSDGSCEWGNDPTSAVYTKNNCPSPQTGSEYTLQVHANEYVSSEAQDGVGAGKALANSRRDADMPTRGQFLANTTGTCSGTSPQETGQVSLTRAEYQQSKVFFGTTRPSMIKVKLSRNSQNGSSGITGTLELRAGSPSGSLVEALPNFNFAAGANCTTVMTTIGLTDFGTYYVVITSIYQVNYSEGIPSDIAVNTVADFSTQVVCQN